MVAALTLTNRSVAENEARADRLEAQAQAAQARAGKLAAYKDFNALVTTRTAVVQTLAATRFDWGATLEQVSRVVPGDVSLTRLSASTAPGQGGGSVALRSAVESPAIELVGCAPSQARVALLMARLRRLEGVRRVSVSSSDKSDEATAAAGDSAGAASGGCQTTDQVPQFQLVVFFGTPQPPATTPASGGSVKAAIDTLNGGTSGTATTPGG